MFAISLSACGVTKETKEEKAVNALINLAEESGEKIDDQTKDIIKEALESSDELMSEISDEIAQIPQILKVAKSYRDCLADADKKKEAIKCYEEAEEMADDLEIVDEYEDEDDELNADEEFGDWTAEDKAKALAEMDEGLKMMEQFYQ